MKTLLFLLLCVLTHSAYADFINDSPLEAPTKPNVPKVVRSLGQSGIIGFAFSEMQTLAEGGPQYVTLYEVVVRSTQNGRIIKRAKNKVGYKFKIALPPGIYSVQAVAQFRDGMGNRFNLTSLKQVGIVKPDQFRKVVLQFGTN
jgi:hypothetical protein